MEKKTGGPMSLPLCVCANTFHSAMLETYARLFSVHCRNSMQISPVPTGGEEVGGGGGGRVKSEGLLVNCHFKEKSTDANIQTKNKRTWQS
jgi:hypothetical protein